MTCVFISYRRRTAAAEAQLLYDDLVSLLGKNNVFMDVENIPPGKDFLSTLNNAIAGCYVMLVVIDREWTTEKDKKGRIRLKNPDDNVRMEIETALKHNTRIIPVLVNGAQMPRAKELPVGLAKLVSGQGVDISHARRKADISEMCSRLELGVGPFEICNAGLIHFIDCAERPAYLTDEKRIIRHCNKEFQKFIGADPRIVGKHVNLVVDLFAKIVPENRREAYLEQQRAVLQKGETTTSGRIVELVDLNLRPSEPNPEMYCVFVQADIIYDFDSKTRPIGSVVTYDRVKVVNSNGTLILPEFEKLKPLE
jgi:hypothetical protein